MIEPDLAAGGTRGRKVPVAGLAVLFVVEFGLLWLGVPGSVVLAVLLSAAIAMLGAVPNHRDPSPNRLALSVLAGLAGGAGLYLLNTFELARIFAVVVLVAVWLLPRMHRWIPGG